MCYDEKTKSMAYDMLGTSVYHITNNYSKVPLVAVKKKIPKKDITLSEKLSTVFQYKYTWEDGYSIVNKWRI